MKAIKAYECDYCGKYIKTKPAIKKHEKNCGNAKDCRIYETCFNRTVWTCHKLCKGYYPMDNL